MPTKLPYSCPGCSALLKVTSLTCAECGTVVSGTFPLPALSQLSAEEQQFVLDFIKCSGSLKIMAQQLKLSYPSVRNLLDEIIEKINQNEKHKK
jgi:hypothetical protein